MSNEFCTETEHTGTCAKCVYAENERLIAENSLLVSALTEFLEAWDWWQVDDYDRAPPVEAVAELKRVLATAKTPAPGLSSPKPESCQAPTPGPSGSATTEKGKP